MSIEIMRDRFGIAHVVAGSVFELAWAQGHTTALDRARQIELDRLYTVGRAAEVLGQSGVEIDVVARRARLAELAERAFASMDAESQEWFSCYVDGVQIGLGDSKYPGAWEPWTPIAIFAVHQFLFGTFPSKIWRRHIADQLGTEVAEAFLRSPELGPGSNAWVIAGERTASGSPILAGDPHRILESPGCYQQIRLSCDEFDVAGLTFPGVPGVQHFGHAGSVAWAITNAMADYQDVFALSCADVEITDRRMELIEIHGASPIEIETLQTSHGPVVWHESDAVSFAVKTPAWCTGDLGLAAILPLLRSKTASDVDQALDLWVEPVNNVIIADRAGDVRYRVAGRVPVRAEDGLWSGWVESPRESADGGVIVSANEWRGPASDQIGSDFALRARRDRIMELLGDRTDLTIADCEAIGVDVALPAARPLVEFLLAAASPTAQAWVDRLADWDMVMDSASEGAAVFAAVRQALVIHLADDPFWDKVTRQRSDLFAPWWDLQQRILTVLPQWVVGGAPDGLDLASAATTAWRHVADNPPSATWGLDHVWFVEDVGPVQLPGDADTVFSTSAIVGTTAVVRGPVARYIWDLADRGASGWIVPLGSAGDPDSPHHHDQLDHWLAGRTIRLEELQ